MKNITRKALKTVVAMMLVISLAGCGASSGDTEATTVENNTDKISEESLNSEETEKSETISETEAEIVKATESGNILEEKLGGEDGNGRGKTVILGDSSVDRDAIISITFLDSLSNMPNETDEVIAGDVSESQDGSVMAWIIPDEDDNAAYDLYIAGEGGVDAGISCHNLFGDFSNVVSIEFNGCFYTGKTTSMSEMFYGDSALQTLDLNSFDTSNVTIMYEMFYGCSSLTDISASDWDTSKVEDMGVMFQSCNSLENLDIGDWDTSSVTSMGSMFCYCQNLNELKIGSWNTSQVGTIQSMFVGCSSLESLDLSGWDTSNVLRMSRVFYSCTSLTSVNVSTWNTSNVTDMSEMFGYCTALTSLDISSWDISSIEDMDKMFYYCTALTSLDINDWDVSNLDESDMYQMFDYCSEEIRPYWYNN